MTLNRRPSWMFIDVQSFCGITVKISRCQKGNCWRFQRAINIVRSYSIPVETLYRQPIVLANLGSMVSWFVAIVVQNN